VAGDRPDQIAIGTERLAQGVDLNDEVVFLDFRTRPYPAYQLVLADGHAFGIDQRDQHVDGPRTDFNRGAIEQQPALTPEHLESAEPQVPRIVHLAFNDSRVASVAGKVRYAAFQLPMVTQLR
jgi:hypothetical protein